MIYEQADDGGWGAYIPDLPGVVALGSTRDEVAGRIQEALPAYAEELHDRPKGQRQHHVQVSLTLTPSGGR